MDPRIRARRIAVVREAGRRRLRRILVVLAVLLVLAAAALVVWSPLLDVDRVVVIGAGERAAQVRAAAGVDRGGALLLVDTSAVEDRVESLAWVGGARVSRELPGTLRIEIHLRPPVAFVPRDDGSVALVDETGVVTGLAAGPPAGLPALVTEVPPPRPGASIAPATAARVASAVTALAGRVARVSVEHHQAALLLADGVEVRLGDLSHLAEKARSAAAVLGSPGVRGIKYVDVRAPSAPVTG
jgi:cell division protein FtsQ